MTKKPAQTGDAGEVETLYAHPNTKIVKFTTRFTNPRQSSSHGGASAAGDLPWTIPNELVVAAGPMLIYRVPGTVSFLNSGKLLRPIMSRSPCWCVDGLCKFVLRGGRDEYYRIELPGETPEDLEEVENFKVILQSILYYERTPCPFARAFTVDIPEQIEVKKQRRKSHGPAKRWTLDRQYSWRPEGWEPEGRGTDDSASGSCTGSASDPEPVCAIPHEVNRESTPDALTTPPAANTGSTPRAQALAVRSVTSPAQVATCSASIYRSPANKDSEALTAELSEPAENPLPTLPEPHTHSNRPLQAIPTDMPPSPPDSSAGPEHVEPRFRSVSCESRPKTASAAGQEKTQDSENRHLCKEAQVDLEKQSENDLPHHHPTPRELPVTREDSAPGSGPDTGPPDLDARSESVTRDQMQSSLKHLQQPGGSPEPSGADRQTVMHASFDRATPVPPEPRTPTRQPNKSTSQADVEDKYAAIQARIHARRSIGGTPFQPPTDATRARPSGSPVSSSATMPSSSTAMSRQLRDPHNRQRHNEAVACAMAKRACSAFLGPPAHLVAQMLRIAARFARGTFGAGGIFYVPTPEGTPRRVPGTFHDEDDWDHYASNEDDWDHDASDEAGWDEEKEDDFGVPLRSPIRLAAARLRNRGTRYSTRDDGMTSTELSGLEPGVGRLDSGR